MREESILVIGANGELGSVLVPKLEELYGVDSLIASDLHNSEIFQCAFSTLDVTDYKALENIVVKYKVTQIYHLKDIISVEEKLNVLQAWDANMKALFNVLEVSRIYKVNKVFFPSSITVFGKSALSYNTPQDSYLDPATVSGIGKSAGEKWVEYYNSKYNLDVRSIRYPGIICYQSLPGCETTDYAVDIYHKAVLGETYNCYLASNSVLPMIYMEDAINATIALMQAPKKSLKQCASYNLAGVSFSPREMVTSIQKRIPSFKTLYVPDERQLIANSWPASIDDTEAKEDWGWKAKFDLEAITEIMVTKLIEKYFLDNMKEKQCI